MKCSEYLWARCKMLEMLPGKSDLEIDGEMTLMLHKNGDIIENDATGEKMTDVEANRIFGRNSKKLLEAYHLGRKSLFELIVAHQQISDEEWEKAKEEAEKEPVETEETPAE